MSDRPAGRRKVPPLAIIAAVVIAALLVAAYSNWRGRAARITTGSGGVIAPAAPR